MIGNILGHYKITAVLGKGGMGEVYRANDAKLGRDVALKVLPETLARNLESMARFRREAQLLASLNHVNIAAIYGLEESDDRTALVLELVEGETLGERIARGRVPLEEALQIGLQISEGLEAAHEKNIVHRDLKPANVKITPEGVVKVLDFGLGRALEDDSDSPASLSQSPTLTGPATGVGIILGTAGYMAPEQARGRQADRRADIWAFGVVLFETLAGQRAFEGETVSDTLARVLEREPDWDQLPPRVPLELRRLIQRCLTKNVRDRLQAIGDARTLLQELISNPNALTVAAPLPRYPVWKKLLPWAVAAALVPAVWVLKPSPSPPTNSITRLEFTLWDGQVLSHDQRHGVEISPNGQRIAFVANSLDGPEMDRKIYLKFIDQWNATPIPGTEGAGSLFFSPDGEWLGFFTGGRTLKKISVSGGSPVVLSELQPTYAIYGASWGKDGRIILSSDRGTHLDWISESGGRPTPLTKLDVAADEVSHRLPHVLPDGKGILFTVIRNEFFDTEHAQTWVLSTETGKRKLVIDNAIDARYANGFLIFARQGKLFSSAFDLRTLSVAGDPVLVVDGVTQSSTINNNATHAAQFSVSDNGSLVFAPGSIELPRQDTLVWTDRNGKSTPVGTKPMAHLSARLSADGNQIVFNESYGNRNIWTYDVARGQLSRQVAEGLNYDPLWSPDSKRIAFRSTRPGTSGIYIKDLESGKVVRLTKDVSDRPNSWSPDGRQLAFYRVRYTEQVEQGAYLVSVDNPDKVSPLEAGAYPDFSPDGKWLAFCSNECYVQPFPGPGKRVQISTEGASSPAWSKDGKELFYRSGQKIMSVRYKVADGEFIVGKPALLFEGQFSDQTIVRGWDVAPDGRFLMIQPMSPAQTEERRRKMFPTTIRVVLHWTDELRRLLGATR